MKILISFGVGAAMACTPAPAPIPAPAHPVTCPEPPPPECPEPRTRVVRVEPECEPCLVPYAAQSVPEKTAPLTCVLGQVKTAGDLRMVVQRALVVLWHGDRVLAETWTDDLGVFAACVASSELTEPLDVALEISKEPFNPVMLKTRLSQGQHRELQVGFEAEGLTH